MVKSMVLRELHTLEETTMDKVRFLMSDTGAPFTAACREALEQKGVDVTVVEKDGNKVLQKMLTVRPQVVLLDAFMPGLDALAVKQRYNAAGERHTSFFVTGAFQSEEMVQELLDEGFAYYFVKPFDETVLAARVLKAALGPEKHILHTSVDSDELTVTEILHQIGVPAHIKGYQFLRDAILLTMNYTVDLIESCKNSLERLYTCRENLDFALSKTDFGTDETLKEKAAEARTKFCTAMDDDLNTPDALAAVFDLVKEINTLSAASSKAALETAAAAFDEITGVLGLLYNRKKDEVPAEVTALVEKRAAAKKAKDWATADAIRAQLTELGWAVKDTAQGPQLSKL